MWERIYWRECWPTALRNTLKEFMIAGDSAGVMGILSFSVCHRGTATHAYECAIAALVRQIFQSLSEAEKIKQRLKTQELELKAAGLYDVQKKIAELHSRGLVPLARLRWEVSGYRKKASEIYTELKNHGFLTIEEHLIRTRKSQWVGLNANWNGLVQDIMDSGTTKSIWASSAGIMLCMAVTGKGITTVQPMYIGVLAAEKRGGQIDYDELYKIAYSNIPQGKKALDIILERTREKVDPLKLWTSDDGRTLIANRNTIYAVRAWLRETNRLARERGLGVSIS